MTRFPLFCLAALLAIAAGFRPQAEVRVPTLSPQIVGPLVMLRLQREGATILDGRKSGRLIPGARRIDDIKVLCGAVQAAKAPVAVLLEPTRFASLVGGTSNTWRAGEVFLVPAPLLEAPDEAGVRQIEPSQLRRSKAQIIDVSEADEWQHAHLKGSRQVDFRRLLNGDRSFAPRHRAIVFT